MTVKDFKQIGKLTVLKGCGTQALFGTFIGGLMYFRGFGGRQWAQAPHRHVKNSTEGYD